MVPAQADTCAPRGLRAARTSPGLRTVCARCTYQPPAYGTHRRRRAARPQGATHCAYAARVPASGGVPYPPRAPCPPPPPLPPPSPGTNKVRGVARAWDLATGRAEPIGGTPPDNRVSDIAESADGLVVCAQDNSVYFVDTGAAPLQFGPKLSFENAPKQMSAAGSTVAVTSQSPRVARSPQTHRSPQAQLAPKPSSPADRRRAPTHPHLHSPALAAAERAAAHQGEAAAA